MTVTEAEIASQPQVWRAVLERLPEARALLAAPGERMLLIGCGTSAFVADALAHLREAAGLGETDAAFASEPPLGRQYDRVIAICRSGTTTEVLSALAALSSAGTRGVVTAVAGMPVEDVVDRTLVLAGADEASVVQTRFPTAVLLLGLAALVPGGVDPGLADECEAALAEPLPVDPATVRRTVFLGSGWTRGLADEAALKVRESAQAWSESYPLLDYRHGPIAVADAETAVWVFGPAPADLLDDIRRTGAQVVTSTHHPLVQLVRAQRFAVGLAALRGLDPDRPRHLTRSVILPAGSTPSPVSSVPGSSR